MSLDRGQVVFLATLIAALAGGTLAALVWRHLVDARRARMRSWAEARGWHYVGRDERFFAVAQGPPFDAGLVRSMRHLMAGSFDHSYVGIAFQFTNLEYTGRHLSIRTYCVVALQAPAQLPGVLLERETLRTRAETAIGHADVEVESDDVNRAYRVRAVDPRFASDLLNPRTMEVLQRAGYPEVQVRGRYLVVHGPGRLDVDRVDPALTLLAMICDHLPSFVWTDRGVDPPAPLRLGAPRPGRARRAMTGGR